MQEKVITLAVAKMLAEYLAPIAEVLLTRTDDSTPGGDPDTELSYRAKMANDFGADLFVSIHCNAAANREANGTETYHAPGSEKGARLAEAVQGRLVSILGLFDRGVKQANYAVLKRTSMPAALVELAFISNPTEEGLLEMPDFQRKCAKAIALGIADYLGVSLPERGNQEMLGKRKPEEWEVKAVIRALSEGLITQEHDPTDVPSKAFVLQTELNLKDKILEKVREMLGK